MQQVAPDVWRISLPPKALVNVYLVGDVLIDAGLSVHACLIKRTLRDANVTVRRHVATHAHVDHVGGMRNVAHATGAPVSIGDSDRPHAATGRPPNASTLETPVARAVASLCARFEPFAVQSTLSHGDDIGHGFRVIETPGHTPGHISLWREDDRTLIAGDVFAGQSLLFARPGLYEPPKFFSVDAGANRASARKVADLEPATVCFGHGPPLFDAAGPIRALTDAFAFTVAPARAIKDAPSNA